MYGGHASLFDNGKIIMFSKFKKKNKNFGLELIQLFVPYKIRGTLECRVNNAERQLVQKMEEFFSMIIVLKAMTAI